MFDSDRVVRSKKSMLAIAIVALLRFRDLHSQSGNFWVKRKKAPLYLCMFMLGMHGGGSTWSFAATKQPVYGKRGMVVSTSDLASEVGAQILKDGGNAADAAVGVAFALAVTWPSAGNIGGGGFALVRLPTGESRFLDYREVAPRAAQANFFLDSKGAPIAKASTVGHRAAGVPGTVAGLELLHKRWGRLPWERLVEPAQILAEKGYRLNHHHVKAIAASRELLQSYPETHKIFFPNGRDPEVGDLFVQKDLAKSIHEIKVHGAKAFYHGSIARLITEDQKAHGGALSAADLESYKVEEREPLYGEFHGHQVITAPPPSSGGATLIQLLTMLEHDDLKKMELGSSSYLHLLVESMKRAFADRSEWYGDPAFVNIPMKMLLSADYLKKRRAGISPVKASRSQDIAAASDMPGEKLETTHFTVVDASGFAISNTYTLNGSFGSGVVPKGTGILLNNEMDDFMIKPGLPNMFGLIQSTRNKIAPGKRPLSSMTPTIFVKDQSPVLVVGSPGGPTIINTVLQVSLNVLVHGYDVQAAVEEPRVHHQWMPDEIRWEPHGISFDTRARLETLGHFLAKEPRYFGDAQAVTFDRARGEWAGGADSRWGGTAVAP
jgi:gamma-glutamyltranspeptidase/glutathione hydrolase